MIKRFVLLAFLLLATSASAATLIADIDDGAASSTILVGKIGGQGVAQSFNYTVDFDVETVEVYIISIDSGATGCTGLCVSIEADNAGEPSLNSISQGCVANASINAAAFNNFTMNATPTLTNGTTYWFRVWTQNNGVCDTDSDGYRVSLYHTGDGDKYAGGVGYYSINNGTTWTDGGTVEDVRSLVWGTTFFPGIINFTFLSQYPTDLNSINAYESGFNATFNVTQYTENVYLWHRVNTTTTNEVFYTNGTATPTDYQISRCERTANYTDKSTWNCTLYPCGYDLYPGTFNLNATYEWQNNGDWLAVNNTNQITSTQLLNVSNTTRYGYLTVTARNDTATASPLEVFYCNSSYTTGNYAVSPYCAEFGSVPAGTPYNCSTTQSYLIPFAVENELIGGVAVTNDSRFLFRADGGDWSIEVLPNVSRSDATQYSTTNGNAWTNYAGTLKTSLRQYDEDDTLWYFLQATINGTIHNSSNYSDAIGLSALAPTSPNPTSPTSGYYVTPVNVTWGASNSPTGNNISYYNVSLYYTNFSLVAGSTVNASNALYYNYDLSGYASDDYVFGVLAVDNASIQSSVGYTQEFSSAEYNATPSSVLSGETFEVSLYAANLSMYPLDYVTFEFNGSNYTVYGADSLFTRTLTTPEVDTLETLNVTAWFHAAGLSDRNESVEVTVNNLNITWSNTTCPTGYYPGLNFSFFDEETVNLTVLSDMDATFTVYNSERTASFNVTINATDTYYAFLCFTPNSTTYLIDSFQIYTADNYNSRNWFLRNASVQPTSVENVSLFNANGTTTKTTKIILKDENGLAVPGAYVTAQRYYPGDNSYLGVAMVKTDNNGEATTYLVPNDEFYLFNVIEGFEVTASFSSRQVICDPGLTQCTVTLQKGGGELPGYWEYYDKISSTCGFNTATNISHCTFEDTSGVFNYYEYTVLKLGIKNHVTVCEETTTASSGTLTCNVTGYGDGEYVGSLIAYGSTNAANGHEFNVGSLSALFGSNAAFLGGLIVITMTFAAAASPAAALVFSAGGLIVGGLLGFLIIDAMTIAAAVVLAVIVAWKVKE